MLDDYYKERIVKVLNYIDLHLDQELKINQLAEVANFSSFHFQRIYKSVQSETPYETTQDEG